MFMPTAQWWWACAVIQGEGGTHWGPQSRWRKPAVSSVCFLGSTVSLGVLGNHVWHDQGICKGPAGEPCHRDPGFASSSEVYMACLWDGFSSWYETSNSEWSGSRKILVTGVIRLECLMRFHSQRKPASLCCAQVASMRNWAMMGREV